MRSLCSTAPWATKCKIDHGFTVGFCCFYTLVRISFFAISTARKSNLSSFTTKKFPVKKWKVGASGTAFHTVHRGPIAQEVALRYKNVFRFIGCMWSAKSGTSKRPIEAPTAFCRAKKNCPKAVFKTNTNVLIRQFLHGSFCPPCRFDRWHPTLPRLCRSRCGCGRDEPCCCVSGR